MSPTINGKKYDFLDFGASKGESIEYAKKHFSGKRGLGIDLDAERVKTMNKSGYDCIVGDLTDLHLPNNCVRFVKMSHILEHMPNLEGVEKAIAAGKKVATDFLVITGPFFEEDEYLKSKGLKLEWADYPEHTCHLTVGQLVKILSKLGIDNYELYLRYKITDSSNDRVHPLASPPGSHSYNPKIHPPKKHIEFDRDIWTDFVCYVRLKELKNWKHITNGYRNQIPHIEVDDGIVYRLSSKAMHVVYKLDQDKQQKAESILKLNQVNKELTRQVSVLKRKLNEVQSSKAWKVARLMQKTSSMTVNKRGNI